MELGVGQAQHQEVGALLCDLVAEVIVAQHGLHEAVVPLALIEVGAQGGELNDRAEFGVLALASGEAATGGVGSGGVAQAGQVVRLEATGDDVRAGGGAVVDRWGGVEKTAVALVSGVARGATANVVYRAR